MTERDKKMIDIIPEEISNAMIEAIEPIAPPSAISSELKARVMARIRGKKSFDLITIKAEEGEWITLMPGVEKKILNESADGKIQSYLLKMAPGSTFPPHEHVADEECLMLEGEAMFGDLCLRAGDYHVAKKGSKHGLVSTEKGAVAFIRACNPVF